MSRSITPRSRRGPGRALGTRSATRDRTERGAPGRPRRATAASTLAPMDAPTAEAWHIRPNGPLVGEVEVSGSKNAVTKHMVAAMLGTQPSTITNAPAVGDVGITADILISLGVGVEIDGDRITIDPVEAPGADVPLEFTGLNRIPILLLGPLLARNHEAFVPLVGGDRIGRRPVDFHIDALERMGAEITVSDDGISAKADHLRGAQITLPYPSVGATESVLLTAVLAEGRTVLRNAAVEPEVTELALFLQRMGARIGFKPDRRIVIEGVDHLRGAEARLHGDRLEAFSYLVAGLMTGGQVRVGGCAQDRLVTAIDTLQKMGARFEITDDYIQASADAGLRPARGADRHPPRVHDRLAAAPHRAHDPGRGHVGHPRDRLRGPPRLHRGPHRHGRRDRAVRHLPRRARRAGSTTPTPSTRRWCGACRSCGAPRSRSPTCGPGSRRSSPPRWPTARRRCTASTTSSAATTSRSRRSRRSGSSSSGSPPLRPDRRRPGRPAPRRRVAVGARVEPAPIERVGQAPLHLGPQRRATRRRSTG